MTTGSLSSVTDSSSSRCGGGAFAKDIMSSPVADDVGAAAVAARLADTGTGSRIAFGCSIVLASHVGASGETMPVFGVVVLGLGHGYWIIALA